MNDQRWAPSSAPTRKPLTAFASFLLILFFALPASADEAYDRMLELSGEASQAFRDGDVEQAAQKFADAYEAYPEPVMLKNEMIARFALEQCARAMTLGKQFMQSGANIDAEDIEDVHGVFAECGLRDAERSLNERNYGAALTSLDEATPYFFTDDQVRRGQAVRDALDKNDPNTTAVAPVEPSPREPAAMSTSTMIGIGLTAVGGGTLIGNSIWYGNARRQRAELDEVRAAGVDRERFDELQAKLVTANWAIPTLYVVGAATTATGLYFLFFHDDLMGNAVVVPQISSDGVGASVHMRF